MNFPFRNVQYNQKKCSMFGLVILKTYVPTATHVEGTRDHTCFDNRVKECLVWLLARGQELTSMNFPQPKFVINSMLYTVHCTVCFAWWFWGPTATLAALKVEGTRDLYLHRGANPCRLPYHWKFLLTFFWLSALHMRNINKVLWIQTSWTNLGSMI